MQHRGEIVEAVVRNSGYSITKLADRLGKSRRWLYLVFENPNVQLDHIIAIGKLINYDFSNDIQELKNISDSSIYESGIAYKKNDKDVTYWREKYFELLEDYHQLIKAQQKRGAL
ncbi:MAG: hypothetical protein EP338_07255 [Bacteroidetes bacterium]|nr:MAG: hypothetical protein EP338_07255 [Bacteroidota bacterium]